MVSIPSRPSQKGEGSHKVKLKGFLHPVSQPQGTEGSGEHVEKKKIYGKGSLLCTGKRSHSPRRMSLTIKVQRMEKVWLPGAQTPRVAGKEAMTNKQGALRSPRVERQHFLEEGHRRGTEIGD